MDMKANIIEYFKKILCFLSPKGTLSRKGFICIFICAIVSVILIAHLTYQIFCLLFYPCWRFGFNIELVEIEVFIGVFTGCVPLMVYFLVDLIHVSFIWASKYGYLFLIEVIFVSLLYVMYIFQCIKRCHDSGHRWYFCLIPLYNPFWLLIGKSRKKSKKKEESIEDSI